MNQGVINFFKRVAAVLLLAPAVALAAAGELHLDKAPVSRDPAALQHGAQIFVNYCLSCHGASFVRYNRLTELGLSEEMIKDNLMFTSDKIGEQMKVAIRRDDAKKWFGVAPPDLSVIARARASEFGSGADWLYTYLRSFYRDPERPTGWNNVIFPNVGMPHVLWELQGTQVAHTTKAADGEEEIQLQLAKPGKLSAADYDKAVGDLVSYLVWMGEPVAHERRTIGIFVLAFLAGLFVLSYALKKNYWRDVH